MNRQEKICIVFLIPAATVMASFLSPALGLLQDYFMVSKSTLSSVVTYYLAGCLLSQPLWGATGKKIGKVRSIRLGVGTALLGSLFLITGWYIHYFTLFVSGRFLIGFGLSAHLVCGFALVKERLPPASQRNFFTLITVIFTVGTYSSMMLSGFMAQHYSLGAVVVCYLPVCLALLVPAWCLSEDEKHFKKEAAPKLQLQSNTLFLTVMFSLTLAITTLIAYMYAFYAPLIATHNFGLQPQAYSIYSFFTLFFLLLGSFIYPRLAQVMSELALCISGLVFILCANILLLALYSSALLTVNSMFLSFYLMNFVLGAIYPAATLLALEFNLCKLTAATIMNLIKMGVPIVALYLSSRLFQDSIHSFAYTVLGYAGVCLLFLLALQYQKKNFTIA